ncbi:metal-dependent hydrolase family protein [Galbitalea soli]|uniref:Amidohydrolase family protein n=1 Tax=Galbitalea soli TaxID=1268042 RepID=A0A7C9PNF2_9MICO|nr:amidohydrolase family protein [Galbitalea soli]NEM91507.1 amidohydrolase family protein [Galbitalea soli]NYJ30200.1 imidazolonepropionase-like amidohydrolase [Galbitalea soli]
MTDTITGISTWDGERSLGAVTIGWSGDRIESVTAATDALPGYSLIPGLVDTHVHLDTSVLDGRGPGDAWPLVTPDAEKAMHVAAHAQRFAAHGVTTLRDLAATPVQMAVGRAFDQGVLQGPRLLSDGPVGMTAGHGDLFTPPRFRDRPPVADSPDECRRLVRQWAREGAHGIKIYTSGGIFSMGDRVGWRNQTRAELEATVDEAHALGMLVAAHSHTAEGIDIALAVGADSIEHATGVLPEQFDRLVAANIPVSPTLIINDVVAAGLEGVREDATAKAREVVGGRDPAFLAAGRAGVRFVLGTDANGRFVRHGEQLREVRMMAAAFDWTAERALIAATSDAADSIGLGATVGRITVGLGADFVIVRGRPWEDIADLAVENIQAVVSRGRLIAGSLPVGGAA